MKWQDNTNYKRSRQPRSLSLGQDGMQLVIHRFLKLPGWYMSLRDNGVQIVDMRKLTDAEDLEAVKTIALEEAIDMLAARAERYRRFVEDLRGTS